MENGASENPGNPEALDNLRPISHHEADDSVEKNSHLTQCRRRRRRARRLPASVDSADVADRGETCRSQRHNIQGRLSPISRKLPPRNGQHEHASRWRSRGGRRNPKPGRAEAAPRPMGARESASRNVASKTVRFQQSEQQGLRRAPRRTTNPTAFALVKVLPDTSA